VRLGMPAHRRWGRSCPEAEEPAPEALHVQAGGLSRRWGGEGQDCQQGAPGQDTFQGPLRHFDSLPRPRSRVGTDMAPAPADATSHDFMCRVWQRTRRSHALPYKGMGRSRLSATPSSVQSFVDAIRACFPMITQPPVKNRRLK